MTLVVPDYTANAARLVDDIAGLVAAGRRDVAITHARVMLRIACGDGVSLGFGDLAEADKAAQEWRPFQPAGRD